MLRHSSENISIGLNRNITFMGGADPSRTKCSHAGLCPTDTGARAGAWAVRCRGCPARRVERASIWLLRDGRARAEPCDPHTDLRGPRRNPERFATTSGKPPPQSGRDRLLARIIAATENLMPVDLELAACQLECLMAHRSGARSQRRRRRAATV